VHHPAGVVEDPGTDLRHGHLQRERLAQLLHLLGGERQGDLAQRRAQRGDGGEFWWLALERREQPGVHVVLDDHVFLGREVPEEGGR
jgi:hypothetical protein